MAKVGCIKGGSKWAQKEALSQEVESCKFVKASFSVDSFKARNGMDGLHGSYNNVKRMSLDAFRSTDCNLFKVKHHWQLNSHCNGHS